jgi:hypothetical protein
MIHLIDVLLPEHEIAQSVSRYPDWECSNANAPRTSAGGDHARYSGAANRENHHAKMACRFRKSDSCASMVEHCAA